MVLLRSEIPSGLCAKLRTVAASNNTDHASQSLLLLLARATHIYCCSSLTSRSWWITQSTQCHRRGCNNIPSFLQRITPIARSVCEGWTRHDLHSLVTAPFCWDRKSRGACAQSFAPWQQATIEMMRRNISYYCLFAPSSHSVFLRAHPVRGESHNQRNTTGEVATVPELFYKNGPESLYIENWGTMPPIFTWCVTNFGHLTALTFQCDFKCKTCLAKHEHRNLICEEPPNTMTWYEEKTDLTRGWRFLHTNKISL